MDPCSVITIYREGISRGMVITVIFTIKGRVGMVIIKKYNSLFTI
jgi:hypothetical protein